MDETMRTTIYVVLAIVSLVVAGFSGPNVAKSPKEFSQVGTLFYPDFKDAGEAKSLQVVSYNSDNATVRVFGIEQGPDGVWRIPTRNNYPVDGKDRLAKSATSIIGIKREALVGQRKSQHAEFGVLDPLSESVSDFKGVGNRLTLKDSKDGKTLVDLIIGKEVKGRNGYFYVRNPKEDQVYIAKVGLELSTKFTDWIEPDLLKVDSSKLRSVVIDKHTIEFTPQGRPELKGDETNTLTKGNAPGDKWKLEGLNDATEEVNEEEVRKLVQSLDDLKIIGVRQKGEKLKKSLQDEKGMAISEQTQRELADMGYYLFPTPDRRIRLVSQEGDLYATTDQGVLYKLNFGTTFSGTEDEVEAGFINKTEGENPEAKKEEAKDDSKAKKINSRYLFVQAFFDAEGLGPKPVEPEKPEPPAEETKSDEAKPDADKPAAEKTDADKDAEALAKEKESAKNDLKKAYDAALVVYQSDMKKFETDSKAYEEKIKTGQKLVKDLNRRFAEWYYVISGDSFESLRQGRKTLVKEKPAANKPAEQKPGEQKQDEPATDEK